MTTQKEPREFWITEPTLNRTCRGHTLAYDIKKHPTPPKRPGLHMEHFKVIEYSAYLQMKEQRDKAVEALKFYANENIWEESEAYAERLNICGDARLLRGHYRVGGKLAADTLKELGELKDGGEL